MGERVRHFVVLPYYGSFLAVKCVIMVVWEHDDFSYSPKFFRRRGVRSAPNDKKQGITIFTHKTLTADIDRRGKSVVK